MEITKCNVCNGTDYEHQNSFRFVLASVLTTSLPRQLFNLLFGTFTCQTNKQEKQQKTLGILTQQNISRSVLKYQPQSKTQGKKNEESQGLNYTISSIEENDSTQYRLFLFNLYKNNKTT